MASYNILLKACCLAGRVDLAQDIYREVQHLESSGMLKLDVFTYSTIVKVTHCIRNINLNTSILMISLLLCRL
jgi:pentatricopeptide repeat protein